MLTSFGLTALVFLSLPSPTSLAVTTRLSLNVLNLSAFHQLTLVEPLWKMTSVTFVAGLENELRCIDQSFFFLVRQRHIDVLGIRD